MNRGPIFIGGPDRCGKTMMRAFLVSHPHISIPAIGSNMWTYFYGQYGDLCRPDNFERCLAAMLRYKHVRFLKPDTERIRREFWQGEPTYAGLFALFQQHHAERAGKTRWGDQSGLIERYAELIFAAYPSAKMIHMIRDPRDRYEASLTRWQEGKGRAGSAAARWLYSVRLAKRNLQQYPDRYKVVRYETMVTQPEESLRDVCAFLGEDFDPAMLRMEGASGYRDKISNGFNGRPGQIPVSTEFIGRFRQGVPKREIAFLQACAKREMVDFEYQPEPVQFTFRDSLLFWLVDRPANFGRLITWYSLEAIQHNFPSLMGRVPSAGKLQ